MSEEYFSDEHHFESLRNDVYIHIYISSFSFSLPVSLSTVYVPLSLPPPYSIQYPISIPQT